METGRIKRLVRDRGFGFIKTRDGKDLFFHRSECRQVEFDSLKEGQEVRFDLERDPKGPRARNVRLTGSN